MSPRSLSRASNALRSAPLGSRSLPQCLSRTQCRWESNEPNQELPKKKKPPTMSPFREKLFASMGQRIAREQEQLEKLAVNRQGTAYGKLAACIVGLSSFLFMGFFMGVQKREQVIDITSTTTIDDLDGPRGPHLDVSEATMEAAFVEFEEILGRANVSLEKGELRAVSGSEWSSKPWEPNDLPFCIAKPRTTEEVSKIMKVCHERRIPVTAYSGGTSLEGHFAATRGGVTIDFTHMDKILKLNSADLDVIVQPAVGWEYLNEELAKSNLFFPPDPGPGAKIGGMIGTGCSGTNAYRYGTMKDWVLSLTVVLADGTIIKTRQRPRKSSAGYDLTRLFVGSEGTLGLVTEATLKLAVKPQSTSVAVCAFPSVRAAADCAFRVVGAGVPVAAVELLDDVQMACINDAGTTSRTWAAAPTLFFKFAGTPSSVKEQIAQVKQLAKRAGSTTFEFAKNEVEKDDLWQARKEALWSVMAKGQGDEDMGVWTTDVAVPISRLPDIIEITKEDIKGSGLLASIVGHVGDGNFHAIILYNKKTDYEKTKKLVSRMVKRAIDMEGTATGEHGIGLVKRDYLSRELGDTTVAAMRKIKLAYDPQCLLNCDKVVRMEAPKAGEVEQW
ncbi:hypothetical protein M011DRAFT_463956 [Sporormia fimetaria CBS 119925]|uniref:D-lactate dehydrogenase (cytochrome) n=1 Tax=Sporormia fimetaria CBS 119925 TaxID=1340428 RepID=A0A6A6VNS9_9PLEO|nr:hypothetical protein M011DRAFT_463956 [Sporormia fimetaria CBS 119925]